MENRKTLNRARRALVVLVLLLTAVFAFLWALGRGGEYAAERALWHLVRTLEILSVDADHVPKVILDDLNAEFEAFYQEFPDTVLRPTAMLKQSRIFLLQNDYASARRIIETMVEDYQDDPNIAVAGLAEIGRTFSLQNDLPAVVQTYRRIWEKYPLSELGLVAPLSIVQLTGDPKNLRAKDVDFIAAETFYRQLMLKKEELVAFRSYGLLAQMYAGRSFWDEAFRVYQDLLLEYADTPFFTPPLAETVLRSINTIGMSKLKDKPRLIQVYQAFVELYPNHPIIPTVRGILNSLEGVTDDQADDGAQG